MIKFSTIYIIFFIILTTYIYYLYQIILTVQWQTIKSKSVCEFQQNLLFWYTSWYSRISTSHHRFFTCYLHITERNLQKPSVWQCLGGARKHRKLRTILWGLTVLTLRQSTSGDCAFILRQVLHNVLHNTPVHITKSIYLSPMLMMQFQLRFCLKSIYCTG